MQIGTVKIDGRLVLAPMAGVTDLAFRRICREHGAALTVTEMVSTKALCYQDRKTPRLLELAPDEHPAAAQIFGHEPETMAEGARIALEKIRLRHHRHQHGLPCSEDCRQRGRLGAHARPAARLARHRSGRQGRERPRYRQIPQGMGREKRQLRRIRPYGGAVRRSHRVDHGRTRALEQYSGCADWDAIRAVRQAVSIPVIANGDVAVPEDAVRILEYTGADGAMIGRGALGDPWIFERANALLETGICPPLPPFAVRMDTAVRQIESCRRAEGRAHRHARGETARQLLSQAAERPQDLQKPHLRPRASRAALRDRRGAQTDRL